MIETVTNDMIDLLCDRVSKAIGSDPADVQQAEMTAMFDKTLDALEEDLKRVLARN